MNIPVRHKHQKQVAVTALEVLGLAFPSINSVVYGLESDLQRSKARFRELGGEFTQKVVGAGFSLRTKWSK